MQTHQIQVEPVLQSCQPCSNKLIMSSKRPTEVYIDRPGTAVCKSCTSCICEDCTRFCDVCDEIFCFVCVKTAFDRDDMQLCPTCFQN